MTPQDFFGCAKPMAYVPAEFETPGASNGMATPVLYPYAVFGINGKPTFSLSIDIKSDTLVINMAATSFALDRKAETLGDMLCPKMTWVTKVKNIPLPHGYTPETVAACLDTGSDTEKLLLLTATLSAQMRPSLMVLRGTATDFERHCHALSLHFKEQLSFSIPEHRDYIPSTADDYLHHNYVSPHRAKMAIYHAIQWFQPVAVDHEVIEGVFRTSSRQLRYRPASDPTAHEKIAAARLIRDFYDAHKTELKITKKWLDGLKTRIGI